MTSASSSPGLAGKPSPYPAVHCTGRGLTEFANGVVSRPYPKKQQMRWTPEGAHLLLQTRTRTLNGELATTFRSWYPDFSLVDEVVAEELPSAA
jgi:hypothetical protein